jgi:hypothetical protein
MINFLVLDCQFADRYAPPTVEIGLIGGFWPTFIVIGGSGSPFILPHKMR